MAESKVALERSGTNEIALEDYWTVLDFVNFIRSELGKTVSARRVYKLNSEGRIPGARTFKGKVLLPPYPVIERQESRSWTSGSGAITEYMDWRDAHPEVGERPGERPGER